MLTPWVREKRMRNQLRLILKDHLDAGPKRRSTITKLVHDAHQTFPVWRNQIREKVQFKQLVSGRALATIVRTNSDLMKLIIDINHDKSQVFEV